MIPPKDFKVEIMSATEVTQMTVEWLEVQSVKGYFVIGPDHSPLVCLLKKDSKITYGTSDGEVSNKQFPSGVCSIGYGMVTILVDI